MTFVPYERQIALWTPQKIRRKSTIISISVNKKVCWQKQGQSSSSKTSSTKKATSMMNTTATSSSKDRLMKRLLRGNKRQGKTKGGKGQGQLLELDGITFIIPSPLLFHLGFNLPSATRFFPLLIFKGIPLDVAKTASTRDLMPNFFTSPRSSLLLSRPW